MNQQRLPTTTPLKIETLFEAQASDNGELGKTYEQK
jgi:hypothetical protein